MNRLRPWVRWASGDRVLLARPNPDLACSQWTQILWDLYFFQKETELLRQVTRLTSAPQSLWWLELAGETGRPRPPLFSRQRLEQISCAAARRIAAGLWYPHQACRFGGMVRRRQWPLGLLYEMALADHFAQLDLPQAEALPWVGGLATVAAVWFGAPKGILVWNSLLLARNHSQLWQRWKLALEHHISPSPGMSAETLRDIEGVLREGHPDLTPHWECLLLASDISMLGEAWKQPLPPALLLEICCEMDEDLERVAEQAPHRLQAFLDLRRRWEPYRDLLPEKADWEGRLWLKSPDFSRRLVLLACLGQIESQAPNPLLLQLAAAFPEAGGSYLTEAARRLASYGSAQPTLEQTARQLGVLPEKLQQMCHWRQLSGQREGWPKSLRKCLAPLPRSSEDQELRRLLRLQQGIEASLQAASAQAWRHLLRQVVGQLLADCLDLCASQINEAFYSLGWLLGKPEADTGLMRALILHSPLAANQKWLQKQAPPQLVQARWLQGIHQQFSWQGREFTMATATPEEAVHMGSYFNTCLTLRGGEFSYSVLVNALDVNKMVVYLRNSKGQPLLRQLVAVSQKGQLVTYPLYKQPGHDELLPGWKAALRAFAGECGLQFGDEPGLVLQLNPQSDYYCDRPEWGIDEAEGVAREDSFWRDPASQDPLFHQLEGPCSCIPDHETRCQLGRLGATDWLQGQANHVHGYLRHLDYAADPWPISGWLGQRTFHCVQPLPVALVALPVRRLLLCLARLNPRPVWPGQQHGLQAMILLFLSWQRQRDPRAVWEYLQGCPNLRPLLWWFAGLVDLPEVRPLLSQSRLTMVPAWLAAGRQGLHLPLMRERLLGSPGNVALAAALSRSPDSADHAFARNHLCKPFTDSILTKALAAEVTGDFRDLTTYSHTSASFQDLIGDPGSLMRWVQAEPVSWRLELLARLRRDGQLRIEADHLLEWFQIHPPDCNITRELCAELRLPPPPPEILDLLRPNLRQPALQAIEAMPAQARFELILKAWMQVHPRDWELLTGWVPTRAQIPEDLWRRAQQLARNTRRLAGWLESIRNLVKRAPD